MSYILDALKKSDQERKRGDVPNLQTVHIPISAEQHKPWLLYGLISVLLILLAFFIGMIISDKGISTDHESLSSQKNIRPELEPAVVETGEPVTKVPLTETEKDDPVIPVVKQQLAQPVVVPVENEAEKKLAAIPQSETPVENSEITEADLSDIPYMHELPDYQQNSIPQMSFAGHVYSSSSSNRSVIINGYAMSEGDSIVQGLNVVQITPNGVVFQLHDVLFRMDILQDWSFE